MDIDLYDRLMSLLRGENSSEKTEAEHEALKVPASATELNRAIEMSPTQVPVSHVAPQDMTTCICATHNQRGDGIKRIPPEDWLSFQDFVRKRKQPSVTKKKKKCVNKRGR